MFNPSGAVSAGIVGEQAEQWVRPVTKDLHVYLSPQQRMCDRPKIHIFLGAPPPSSGPSSPSESAVEAEDQAPAPWRHLELTWMDGRLRLATGEAFMDPAVKSGFTEGI